MSFTRGTTQIHAFIENAPHGSIKPLTVFAGSREALLISDKKRSAVRLGSDKFKAHRYRLAPNAGSLKRIMPKTLFVIAQYEIRNMIPRRSESVNGEKGKISFKKTARTVDNRPAVCAFTVGR